MHTVFSFLLFSLSLSLSVFERQQQQARQSSRPRRGLLAFSCHSGENTAESRRASEGACVCVCVRARASARLLRQERKKEKALRFYTHVPSHKKRRKKEKNNKEKHTKKKKSERGSELSVLSQRKTPTRITGVH